MVMPLRIRWARRGAEREHTSVGKHSKAVAERGVLQMVQEKTVQHPQCSADLNVGPDATFDAVAQPQIMPHCSLLHRCFLARGGGSLLFSQAGFPLSLVWPPFL
eukprot:1158937-Rhodomonas_salina.1